MAALRPLARCFDAYGLFWAVCGPFLARFWAAAFAEASCKILAIQPIPANLALRCSASGLQHATTHHKPCSETGTDNPSVRSLQPPVTQGLKQALPITHRLRRIDGQYAVTTRARSTN